MPLSMLVMVIFLETNRCESRVRLYTAYTFNEQFLIVLSSVKICVQRSLFTVGWLFLNIVSPCKSFVCSNESKINKKSAQGNLGTFSHYNIGIYFL